MKMIFEPARRARVRAPRTNDVMPLAETPTGRTLGLALALRQGLGADVPVIVADPALAKEADAVCRTWAVKDLDCPSAGASNATAWSSAISFALE